MILKGTCFDRLSMNGIRFIAPFVLSLSKDSEAILL